MNVNDAETEVMHTIDSVSRGMSDQEYVELLGSIIDNLSIMVKAKTEEGD